MLEWLLVGAGFTGALSAVFVLRMFARQAGWMPTETAHFTTRGDCTEAIVGAIRRARYEILVQANTFASPAIADALAEARKRGVFVSILLDRANERQTYAELSDLPQKGLLPLVSSQHTRLHDQVLVIDRQTVVTGSFPFLPQDGKEHGGNVVVLHGHAELAEEYRRNFMKHLAGCVAPTAA